MISLVIAVLHAEDQQEADDQLQRANAHKHRAQNVEEALWRLEEWTRSVSTQLDTPSPLSRTNSMMVSCWQVETVDRGPGATTYSTSHNQIRHLPVAKDAQGLRFISTSAGSTSARDSADLPTTFIAMELTNEASRPRLAGAAAAAPPLARPPAPAPPPLLLASPTPRAPAAPSSSVAEAEVPDSRSRSLAGPSPSSV
ncbi:hypothetical protein TSOC_001565 [Tetrabaena socialis]|uniref:Uncharacterized protein n=1 Tax=Tetrabaena socialis TaxID=47790 RepID=A0A2J8AGF8_9CHLO|nr:hypothetical protein TSOC_001565 [Tetrabaena socialis]|eukprot:PNH11597.1 hypothetical protein TSOC_001565 [Tetrabaena socialis]